MRAEPQPGLGGEAAHVAAYLAFYAWFLYYVYMGQPLEARVGLVLIAAGLPVYIGYRLWASRVPENMLDGE